MKSKEQKKRETKAFFKDMLKEFSDSIIVEVIWNIVMFIPRIIIRFVKEIW